MCQFIESIKLQDGNIFRLQLHQERINRIFDVFFPEDKKIILLNVFKNLSVPQKGTFKVRIIFDSEIRNLEFVPYQLPHIKTLKVIETNIETTFYKSTQRDYIQAVFANKEECDDVLMVKNGLITDTSYCNVALYDGKYWFTPKAPIIYGTQRTNLLNNALIIEKDIGIHQLGNFQTICLFNAMIEFGEITFSVQSIKKLQ